MLIRKALNKSPDPHVAKAPMQEHHSMDGGDRIAPERQSSYHFRRRDKET